MQAPPLPTQDTGTAATTAWSLLSGATDSESSSNRAGRKAPARKRTYIVRKEEKDRLLKELQLLQFKLRLLQRRKSHLFGSSASFSTASAAHPELLQHELSTSLLGEAVRFQQLSLVRVQSAVSGYVSTQESVPHDMTIHLTADPEQRRAALLKAKPCKLRAALAYLTERTRFLDTSRSQAESAQFMQPNGDFCVQRLSVTVFEGVTSVRQVYDAARHSFNNMELSLTDELGDITTRDDMAYDSVGVRQSRMVSNLSCGVEIEVNEVMNFEFCDDDQTYGHGGPLGLITADFVDRDDLYPYLPNERMRLDVTSITAVRPLRRKRVNPVSGVEEDEQVVVLTGICFIKLHGTRTTKSPLVQHQLQQQLPRWGDVMTNAIVESVYTAPSQ